MARKKGAFNKILEFIGLVDDEESADIYDDEYEVEETRRPRVNVPHRETKTEQTRTQNNTRRQSDFGVSRSASRSAASGRPQEPRQQSRYGSTESYSSSRFAPRNDFSARASRFDDTAEREEPAREKRRPARQRTVMFSIHEVKDCCDVIDNLILNNTVLLNMEELDSVNMQRSVDTLCGAVFALHATIKKISERTYVVAPMNVEVDEAYTDRRM